MNRPNRPPRRLCLLLALLLGILPGCGRSAAPSRSADGIRVGVALYQQNDTFIATIVSSLEAAAREREADEGLKITLNITDGRGSQATQNEQIDRFLSTGYDVICVNLVDRTAAAVIVDKAKSAGIPLIFFNREPVREDIMRWDKVYYVGAEAGKSGSWLPRPTARTRRPSTAAATECCNMSCSRASRGIRTPCCAPSIRSKRSPRPM